MNAPHTTGLCASCRYVRPQPNDRGSVFWRCARAETDRRYPKYPPLPVLRCPGYEGPGSADPSPEAAGAGQ